VNSYEASKHEAEELILSEPANLPAGVYRLSSVIDLASNEGHIRQVLRFAAWAGHFPFFPGDPSIPVDFISSGWAARSLSTLIVHHAESGCVRHICAGEANALPVGTILDRIFAAYESYTRTSAPRPDLVPLEEFERLRAQLRPSSRMSRVLESLMTFIPHVAIHQPFENTTTSALLAQRGVPNADMDSVLADLLGQEFSTAALARQRARPEEKPC